MGPDRTEPIDPDVDLQNPGQQVPTPHREWDLLVAIAVGGLIGAEARYGLGVLVPHQVGQFAWSTLLINISGCFLLGALMVVLLELITPHRLARPFLGVGILGGYTTYSTFAVDIQQMLVAHRVGTAASYLVATVVLCAVAVWLATVLTRAAGRRWSGRGTR